MPRMSTILKMQIWSCYCPLKNSPMDYHYPNELYVIDLVHVSNFVSHQTPTHPLFILCFKRIIFYFLNIVNGSGPLHMQVSLLGKFFFLDKWNPFIHTQTGPVPHPLPLVPPTSLDSVPLFSRNIHSIRSSRIKHWPRKGNALFLDSSKHYQI